MPASDDERALYGQLTDDQKAQVGAMMRMGHDPTAALQQVASGGAGTSAARGFAHGATMGFDAKTAGLGAAAGARDVAEGEGWGARADHLLHAVPFAEPFAAVTDALRGKSDDRPMALRLASLIPGAGLVRETADLAARPEYDQGKKEAELRLAASSAQHPLATGAATAAGAVLPGVLLRGVGPSVAGAPEGAGLGLRLLQAGKAAAAPGAAIGAGFGAGGGDASNPLQFAGDVATGALSGGALGFAGGAGGELLRSGANAALESLPSFGKNMVSGATPDVQPPEDPGLRLRIRDAMRDASGSDSAADYLKKKLVEKIPVIGSKDLANSVFPGMDAPAANAAVGADVGAAPEVKLGGFDDVTSPDMNAPTREYGNTQNLIRLKEQAGKGPIDPVVAERALRNLDAGNSPAQAAKLAGITPEQMDELAVASRTTGGTGGPAGAVMAPRPVAAPPAELTPPSRSSSGPMMVGGKPWDPVNGPRAGDAVDVPGLSATPDTLAAPQGAPPMQSAAPDAGTAALRLRLSPSPSPDPLTDRSFARDFNAKIEGGALPPGKDMERMRLLEAQPPPLDPQQALALQAREMGIAPRFDEAREMANVARLPNAKARQAYVDVLARMHGKAQVEPIAQHFYLDVPADAGRYSNQPAFVRPASQWGAHTVPQVSSGSPWGGFMGGPRR